MTSCPQDKAWSTWHATITSLAWSLSEYVMTWQSGLTHTAGCPLPVSPVATAGPPGPRHVEAPNLPFSLPALPDQDFDISTCSPSLSLSSASPCPLKTSATICDKQLLMRELGAERMHHGHLEEAPGPQLSLVGPQQTDPTDNCDYKMKDPFIAFLEFLKARKLFELYHNGSFLDAFYIYD